MRTLRHLPCKGEASQQGRALLEQRQQRGDRAVERAAGNALVEEGQPAGNAGGGAALGDLGGAHGAGHAELADVEVGAVPVAAVQQGADHGLAGQRRAAADLLSAEAVRVGAHAAAHAIHCLWVAPPMLSTVPHRHHTAELTMVGTDRDRLLPPIQVESV